MDTKKDGLYILGYKRREEPHYHLTTWMGSAPMYYGVYDHMPKCWDENETAIKIAESEEDLKDVEGDWIAFGWYTENGKIAQAHTLV